MVSRMNSKTILVGKILTLGTIKEKEKEKHEWHTGLVPQQDTVSMIVHFFLFFLFFLFSQMRKATRCVPRIPGYLFLDLVQCSRALAASLSPAPTPYALFLHSCRPPGQKWSPQVYRNSDPKVLETRRGSRPFLLGFSAWMIVTVVRQWSKA
jgi:hypothetical protein